MLTRRRFLYLLAGLPLAWPVLAAAGRRLADVRHGVAPGRTRVVFEFNGRLRPDQYNYAVIDNPPRFYVDIKRSGIARGALSSKPFPGSGIVKRLRSHVGKELRLVLDLRRMAPVEVNKWPTPDGRRDRIVVDFKMQLAARPKAKPKRPAPPPSARPGRKTWIIAIDPGHGGKDPGAVGQRRTREKDVVLSISRKLHALLKAEPGMTPHLTRNRDIYLRLRERTRIARRRHADLFISVHADAAQRKSARGSSVYAVSHRGATSAHASWLADRENAADLKGGVDLADRSPVVQEAMLDMSQKATEEYSLHAGRSMLKSLRHVGKIHSPRVERAAFAVLKAPDIPSILVETGFISNAHEEKLLRSDAYQRKVARALRDGIRDYLRKVPDYS